MAANNDRILTRDVAATAIPSGDKVTLTNGTQVSITHRLGGNFTVVCDFGMFRIDGKEADVLGEEVPDSAVPAKDAAPAGEEHDGPPDEKQLWEALRRVFDPEIPVNIVDLGLVYNLETRPVEDVQDVADMPEKGYFVRMDMTLTAPGCGMGPAIAEDARCHLESVPGVSKAQVEIVWDPPWNQDMISEEGKMQLGLI